MAKSIQICVCMTDEEHKKLKQIAKKERRSVSNLIQAWIAEKSMDQA